MDLKGFVRERLEKQRQKEKELWNYPVKGKVFHLLISLFFLMAFGCGMIISVALDCFEDISAEVSDAPVEFFVLSMIVISVLLIYEYFFYFKYLKKLISSYESKYGSSGVGDAIQQERLDKKKISDC